MFVNNLKLNLRMDGFDSEAIRELEVNAMVDLYERYKYELYKIILN